MTGRLSRKLLTRIIWRTFFLQASWNFDGLQSLGVLYALAPGLRAFYRRRKEDLDQAYRRHLQYFNTHPYMASPILGVMLGLEEQGSSGPAGEPGAPEFREMVTGPYAAMGDAFFWGGVRPLAAAVALLFAVQGFWWAPLVFLVGYNVPHLWVRIFDFRRGYREGLAMIETIRRRHFPDLALRCKDAAVILLGIVCAFLVVGALKQEGLVPLWGLVTLPVLAGGAWLTRKGITALPMLLVASALLLLIPQVG